MTSSSKLSALETRQLNSETKSQDMPLALRSQLRGRTAVGVLGFSKSLRPKPCTVSSASFKSAQTVARTRVLAHSSTRRDRLRSVLGPTSQVSCHMYPAGPLAPPAVNAAVADELDDFDADQQRLRKYAAEATERPQWLGGRPAVRNHGAVLVLDDPRTKFAYRKPIR